MTHFAKAKLDDCADMMTDVCESIKKLQSEDTDNHNLCANVSGLFYSWQKVT